MLIFCIDDDQPSLSLREELLRANGLDVLCATDGRAGIELAKHHKIDAVVLDYVMPEMDGEEVARRQ